MLDVQKLIYEGSVNCQCDFSVIDTSRDEKSCPQKKLRYL